MSPKSFPQHFLRQVTGFRGLLCPLFLCPSLPRGAVLRTVLSQQHLPISCPAAAAADASLPLLHSVLRASSQTLSTLHFQPGNTVDCEPPLCPLSGGSGAAGDGDGASPKLCCLDQTLQLHLILSTYLQCLANGESPATCCFLSLFVLKSPWDLHWAWCCAWCHAVAIAMDLGHAIPGDTWVPLPCSAVVAGLLGGIASLQCPTRHLCAGRGCPLKDRSQKLAWSWQTPPGPLEGKALTPGHFSPSPDHRICISNSFPAHVTQNQQPTAASQHALWSHVSFFGPCSLFHSISQWPAESQVAGW